MRTVAGIAIACLLLTGACTSSSAPASSPREVSPPVEPIDVIDVIKVGEVPYWSGEGIGGGPDDPWVASDSADCEDPTDLEFGASVGRLGPAKSETIELGSVAWSLDGKWPPVVHVATAKVTEGTSGPEVRRGKGERQGDWSFQVFVFYSPTCVISYVTPWGP